MNSVREEQKRESSGFPLKSFLAIVLMDKFPTTVEPSIYARKILGRHSPALPHLCLTSSLFTLHKEFPDP